ncbi:hypothetical protein H9P43_009281 [Blastocladiella emersonii ATCC 22665]|nr:hypothetical protein H9P43_009281 [Blastocladiella emersonii ATCC 22665]
MYRLYTRVAASTLQAALARPAQVALPRCYLSSSAEPPSPTADLRTKFPHSTVPARHDGTVLRKYLGRHHGLPTSLIHRVTKGASVMVSRDGGATFTRERDLYTKLHAGDVVLVREPTLRLEAVDVAVAPRSISQWARAKVTPWIVLENDDVVVINKPSGVPVHGGTKTSDMDNVVELARALKRSGYEEPPRLVHRIDKGTSGLLVLAKTRQAAETLSAAFRNREVEKEYIAVVEGKLPQPSGRIKCDLYRAIVRNAAPTGPSESASTAPPERERTLVVTSAAPAPAGYDVHAAETTFRVLGTAPPLALVALSPITGRKHQLRAVAATVLGAPIVGDYTYGFRDNGRNRPLHLHLYRLVVPEMKIDVTAPVPEHFMATCERVGLSGGPVKIQPRAGEVEEAKKKKAEADAVKKRRRLPLSHRDRVV